MWEFKNYQVSYLIKSRNGDIDMPPLSDFKTKITIEFYCDVDKPIQVSQIYQIGRKISQYMSHGLDENGECKVLSLFVK
jgi:hypothetical protein